MISQLALSLSLLIGAGFAPLPAAVLRVEMGFEREKVVQAWVLSGARGIRHSTDNAALP